MPNTGRIGVAVGRVKPSALASPSEARYAQQIAKQMDAISAKLTAIIQHFDKVTPSAIKEALTPIFTLSQSYVPYASGALYRSGYMEAHKTSRGARGTIGYAKSGRPHYAAFVHEMVHITRAKGKSPKFLERAVNERIHIFKALLVNRYKAVLTGSRGRAR